MPAAPLRLEQLADKIKELSEEIAKEEATLLAAPSAKRVRKTIGEAYEKLRRVMADLDPIKHPGFVFDPSNPNVVGRIVGITMVAQPRKPLALIERFYGSGVYAIYYVGDFPAYSAISKREHPIYVGKADPADPASKTAFEQGDKLCWPPQRTSQEHREGNFHIAVGRLPISGSCGSDRMAKRSGKLSDQPLQTDLEQ